MNSHHPPGDWAAGLAELLHRRPDLAGIGYAAVLERVAAP